MYLTKRWLKPPICPQIITELLRANSDLLKREHLDLQAKLPDGSTVDKVPEMLQALLADRFGLRLHRDAKDQPVYALWWQKADRR